MIINDPSTKHIHTNNFSRSEISSPTSFIGRIYSRISSFDLVDGLHQSLINSGILTLSVSLLLNRGRFSYNTPQSNNQLTKIALAGFFTAMVYSSWGVSSIIKGEKMKGVNRLGCAAFSALLSITLAEINENLPRKINVEDINTRKW